MSKIEITRRKNAKIRAGNVIMRILLLACAVLAYGKSAFTEILLLHSIILAIKDVYYLVTSSA